MVSRRLARECVLQSLYAHTMGGGNRRHIVTRLIRPRLKEDEAIAQFGERLFAESFETAQHADQLIQTHAANWEMVRMAILDRLILRMAICEIVRFKDIPPKVSINEAIDLAKRFSTVRSGPFVNGILDTIVAALDRDGQLHKSGRGLRGMKELRARIAQRGQQKQRT